MVETSTPVIVLVPGLFGAGIARSLGRLGIPVYGVHRAAHSPAASSRYWRKNYVLDLARVAPSTAVDWLSDLAQTVGGRPLLIPTDDASCLFVADHVAALAETFRLPNQPPGLARALSSKEGMYQLCRDHAIPTPATLFPRSRADIMAFLSHAQFPLMLKGIDTQALQRRTGVRMVVIDDAETLLRRYDELESPGEPSLMVQELIPGGADAVWMFNGYFDDASRCLFGLTGKKLRQYPPYTGATSLGLCATNATVANQTTAFMQALGYRGILDIGYKYDARTNQYMLLDVNPRIGSTFRLFVDSAGMDVARALYCDLTSQPVTIGVPRNGRKWVSEAFDLASSWTYHRRGELATQAWLRSFRGVEEAAWFARDDPLPFMAMALAAGRHMLRRARSALHVAPHAPLQTVAGSPSAAGVSINRRQ